MEPDLLKLRFWFFTEKFLILLIDIDLDFWFGVSELIRFFAILISSIFISRLCNIFLIFGLIPWWPDFDCFVVFASLLLTGEDVIGLLDFLEAILICSFVDIGMV